ncbi:unnamed protein product, partial [Ectocarpus fasciculatus]
MIRWTSQFKMMDRLLALKKPITEYFREQPHNSRKLTQPEWTITNEVCSLLSDVSEVTIRMQGAKDTHISQAMFIIHEVMEMLREDSHPIRAQNATEPEEMQVLELSLAAQGVLEVLLDVMEEKQVGKAVQQVERLSALMDPRRKSLDGAQLENGSATLRKKAEEDLKAVIAQFDVQPSEPAPAPAPVLNVLVYLAETEQVEVDDFNVLGFWNRRGTDSVCSTTGNVTSPAEMPYLAFIARLFLGIEATSCQAERNFSALSHLIGHLRCNMLSRKVERIMLIRLNRHLVD